MPPDDPTLAVADRIALATLDLAREPIAWHVRVVLAHVRYVIDDPLHVDSVLSFLVATVADPVHAAILVGTAIGVASTAVGYERVRPLQRDACAFADAVTAYADLVPWLCRLAIGIPLVGAGLGGYYVSPLVPVDARLLFVALGSAIVLGFATRVAATIGLGAFLVGLATNDALWLHVEYVGGFVVLVLVGSGRPSVDDVLERVATDDGTAYGRVDPVHAIADRFRAVVAPLAMFVPVVVRLSLAAAFCLLGVREKLLRPGAALAVVAEYDLTAVVPVAPELWVVGAGLAEIALGLVVAVGWYARGAATLSLGLFTVTLFALPDDPVLAHLPLFGLASILVVTGSGPYSLDARRPNSDGSVRDTTVASPREPRQ